MKSDLQPCAGLHLGLAESGMSTDHCQILLLYGVRTQSEVIQETPFARADARCSWLSILHGPPEKHNAVNFKCRLFERTSAQRDIRLTLQLQHVTASSPSVARPVIQLGHFLQSGLRPRRLVLAASSGKWQPRIFSFGFLMPIVRGCRELTN